MEGFAEDTRFASYVARSLTHAPFTVVDIGCSGGIDPAFRIFGENLRAVGFDPNVDEIGRLSANEAHEGIKYVAAFVDGGEDSQTMFESNPWKRLSVFRTLELRRAEFEEYSNEQMTENNFWRTTQLSRETINLNNYLTQQSIDDIDFVKIDVDGADFAILRQLESMLSARSVLGVGIEVNFYGDADPKTNTFHNVDRFLRQCGFSLFDLSVRRYSNAALPSKYQITIPAQTEFGRILQGDALYLRDLGAETDDGDIGLTGLKIAKLAALFSLFGMPDGAAELLTRFAQQMRQKLNVKEGLDILAEQAQGSEYFGDYEAYVRAFECDDKWFWPALQPSTKGGEIGSGGWETLHGEEVHRVDVAATGLASQAESISDEATLQVQGRDDEWLPAMAAGPAGRRTKSGAVCGLRRRGHIVFGPNAHIRVGSYVAVVTVRVSLWGSLVRARGYVDVALGGKQVAARAVARKYALQVVDVPFEVRPDDQGIPLEIRVHTDGRCRIWVHSVRVHVNVQG